MKNIKKLTIGIALICLSCQISAQVIRKNYREMTAAEKQILVSAFFELGPNTSSGTVVNTYAVNHSLLFNQNIHRVNDFLPWHRWFLLFFEKELQNTSVIGAHKIALPYWDWTSQYYTTAPRDNNALAPLWSNDFLGQFDAAWGLGRVNGGVTLGTSDQLLSVLGNPDFTSFRTNLENSPFHDAAHGWISGVMNSGPSPGDPAFYIHHCMVDKVWQDWHNLTGHVSSFPDEILPNKSNANIPNFPSGVPDVTPTSIIDGRASSMKVWFAENGTVVLDKYTATGTENYHYTGVIEAGKRAITSKTVNVGGTPTSIAYSTGDFIVPSGAVCNFVSGGLQMGTAPSVGSIRLLPGFQARSGSTFSAKINSAYFTDAASGGRTAINNELSNNKPEVVDFEKNLTVYPNPSSGIFMMDFQDPLNKSYEYSVINSLGKTITKGEATERLVLVDLAEKGKGIYILRIKTSTGRLVTKKLVVN